MEILHYLDGQEKIKKEDALNKARVDFVKMSLIASNSGWNYYKLFPEIFGTEDGGDPSADNPDGVEFDVEWEIPSEDEWARIRADLGMPLGGSPVNVPLGGGKVTDDMVIVPPSIPEIPKFDLSGVPDAGSEEAIDNEREWL